MNGKTHMLGGYTASIAVLLATNHPMAYPFIVGSIIGSLFPDVDKNTSTLGRILPLEKIFHHRGFTHSIECNLLTSFMWWHFVSQDFAVGWCIGYLSHTLLDILNKPKVTVSVILGLRISFKLFKVGTVWESVTATVLFALSVYTTYVKVGGISWKI